MPLRAGEPPVRPVNSSVPAGEPRRNALRNTPAISRKCLSLLLLFAYLCVLRVSPETTIRGAENKPLALSLRPSRVLPPPSPLTPRASRNNPRFLTLPSIRFFSASSSASPRLRVKSFPSLSNTPRDRPGFLPQLTGAPRPGQSLCGECAASPSTKQPRGEILQVVAPRLPFVGERALEKYVLDPRLFQRFVPLLIRLVRSHLGDASAHPQQLDLLAECRRIRQHATVGRLRICLLY